MATQTQTSEADRQEEVDFEWMYVFQLKQFMPEAIAKGWMAAMQPYPELCKPDRFLPDNAEAAMYNIVKQHL